MEEPRQKLWIYSELFYPEETSTSYIMSKIANKLVNKYDVEVICGYPSYDKNTSSDYIVLDPRIKLKRINSYRGNKDQSSSRILKLITLSFGFFFHLLVNVKSGAKVFMVTNPATFVVFASIIKFFKKLKITVLVHDIFPENTLAAGFIKNSNGVKYNIIKKLFDIAYSKFDHIVVLGRDMKVVIEEKIKPFNSSTKVTIIENWTEIDNIYPYNNTTVNNSKIVIQFAGNLGAIQGLDSLIEIIGQVKNEFVIFEFIGSGKMKSYLENYVNNSGLKNVVFRPPYPRHDQNKVLNSCSIAIVSLSDKMLGLGVPSKTYNILAAGKPILFIGDKNSEVALLINEYDIGYSFAPNEKFELLNFFNGLKMTNEQIESRFLKGLNSRDLAINKFSEDIILNKFLKII